MSLGLPLGRRKHSLLFTPCMFTCLCKHTERTRTKNKSNLLSIMQNMYILFVIYFLWLFIKSKEQKHFISQAFVTAQYSACLLSLYVKVTNYKALGDIDVLKTCNTGFVCQFYSTNMSEFC